MMDSALILEGFKDPVFLELLAITLAIIYSIIALYSDISREMVPNKLTGLMLITSIILAGLRINAGVEQFLWLYIANFVFGFLAGFLLWHMQAWSGGDAKYFWGLCAIIPYYPEILKENPLFKDVLPFYADYSFGLTVLLNLVIILFLKLLLSELYRSVMEGRIKDLARLTITPGLYLASSFLFGIGLSNFTGIPALAYISILAIFLLSAIEGVSITLAIVLILIQTYFGLYFTGLSDIDSLVGLIFAHKHIFALSFLLSCYAVGARIPFTKYVAIKDLKVGMLLAEEIYIKGGSEDSGSEKAIVREPANPSLWNILAARLRYRQVRYIARPRPGGLNEPDLASIKGKTFELGGFVEINESIILMPFIFSAVILSFFLDFAWLIIR